MIFSHIQKPLGMRKTRVSRRICVHGVPVGTVLFCPYCCATVDTASVTLRATGSRTFTLLPCFVYWLLRLSAIPQETYVSGQPQRNVWATSYPSLSLPAEAFWRIGVATPSRNSVENQGIGKLTSRLESLYQSHSEFTPGRSRHPKQAHLGCADPFIEVWCFRCSKRPWRPYRVSTRKRDSSSLVLQGGVG